MISNFNEVEKSLKRCLKEKVSITTATVVGFLIAGTVAFGADTSPKEYNDAKFKEEIGKIITENENQFGLKIAADANFTGIDYNFDGDASIIQRLITITKGTTTLDAQTNLSTDKAMTLLNIVGVKGDTPTSVTSGATLINSNSSLEEEDKNFWRPTVIVNANVSNVSFTNDGIITKEGHPTYNCAVDLTSFAGKTVTFTNNNEVNGMIKTDDKVTGEVVINLTENSKINGELSFEGRGTRKININNNHADLIINNGLTSEEKNDNDTFVNATDNSEITLNGNIQSKGTTVEFNESTLTNNAAIIGKTGISLLSGAKGTNTKDGSISVSGEGAIGVKVDGASTTFTNDGIITLDGTTNGVGISVTDKGTAVNNGTIALGIGTIENSNKNIAIANTDGTAKNTGKIKITDKTAEDLKDFDFSSLFTGSYINSGMLVDKNGIAIEKENDVQVGGNDVTSDTINNAGKDNAGSSIHIKDDSIIKGSNEAIKVDSLNVTGTVTIANGDAEAPVVIEGTTTNLDANGNLAIGDGAELKINGGRVNGTKENETATEAVTFATTGATLTLAGTTFNGNIGANTDNGILKTTGTDATVITGNVKAKELELAGTTAITGNIETISMAVTAGETRIEGEITGAETITIGTTPQMLMMASNANVTAPTTVEKNATVTYSADSKIIGKGTPSEVPTTYEDRNAAGKTTVTIAEDGVVKAEVDNEGKYVFSNSKDVTVTGAGTVEYLTSNIDKQTVTLADLGSGVNFEKGNGIKFTTNSDFYSYKDGTLTYKLDNVNNKILSDISNKSFVVNTVLSQDPNVREAQFDSIYSNGVYSETVKMAMDTLRMNEDAVLSLSGKPEEGKWTAQGKMLFSRTEYDRTGVIRDFGVETKTTGLLGALEYGVSEKSSVGFAFSGSKQDLDMKKASADGDAFYFGVYGKQDVNNFKLTAGLGYQLDKIDADNNVMVSTGDKYDSKAFSGYAQGKYVINAGNDVTVEPKLKLALTRLTQESAKDKHFEMEKVEATTFDTEVGVDLVKTIKLESGKMNLLAGISYTRSMGDTDNKFKGNFVGTDGTKGERFDVLGANLGENTLKINIGAEVEKDNGFFYNGGLNYKFDNEDRETFGATIGAGYKF